MIDEILRYLIDNCVVLTEDEHKNFHKQYGYGKNTKFQFFDYIQNITIEYII